MLRFSHTLVALALALLGCGGSSRSAEAPGRSYAGECTTERSGDNTLLSHEQRGWSMVLPGSGWDTDCGDPDAATAELESNRGEKLQATITLTADPPSDDSAHFQEIYERAKAVTARVGATLSEPEYVTTEATADLPERSVMLYEVHAEQFREAGMRNFHGYSLMENGAGDVYECHLSGMLLKHEDWKTNFAKYLASCQPPPAR